MIFSRTFSRTKRKTPEDQRFQGLFSSGEWRNIELRFDEGFGRGY